MAAPVRRRRRRSRRRTSDEHIAHPRAGRTARGPQQHRPRSRRPRRPTSRCGRSSPGRAERARSWLGGWSRRDPTRVCFVEVSWISTIRLDRPAHDRRMRSLRSREYGGRGSRGDRSGRPRGGGPPSRTVTELLTMSGHEEACDRGHRGGSTGGRDERGCALADAAPLEVVGHRRATSEPRRRPGRDQQDASSWPARH